MSTWEMKTPVPDSPDDILGVAAAAALLGVSRPHVSHICAGKVAGVPPIPHVRAGRRVLIRRGALMAWFRQQEGVRQ